MNPPKPHKQFPNAVFSGYIDDIELWSDDNIAPGDRFELKRDEKTTAYFIPSPMAFQKELDETEDEDTSDGTLEV